MDASRQSLQQVRDEWRERLRTASERAADQVESMGLADLRALRATIQEEMETLAAQLPEPGPLAAKGPMSAEEQARHVKTALQYNALQVRKQVVAHELRCRALGTAMIEEDVSVPDTTRRLAEIAWTVMGEPDVDTIEAVYRTVAERADDDLHLTTVEMWLRDKNPHHPNDADDSWTDLRRAVLLAMAGGGAGRSRSG